MKQQQAASDETTRMGNKLNPKCKTKRTRPKKKKKKTPAKPQTMQTKHTNWGHPEWVLPFLLGQGALCHQEP